VDLHRKIPMHCKTTPPPSTPLPSTPPPGLAFRPPSESCELILGNALSRQLLYIFVSSFSRLHCIPCPNVEGATERAQRMPRNTELRRCSLLCRRTGVTGCRSLACAKRLLGPLLTHLPAAAPPRAKLRALWRTPRFRRCQQHLSLLNFEVLLNHALC